MVERYLKRHRTIKRLRIAVSAGPASSQLLSTLAAKPISVQLCLNVSSFYWLQEIGTKFWNCSSITSLDIVLAHVQGGGNKDVEAFFNNGITNMRGMRRFAVKVRMAVITQ